MENNNSKGLKVAFFGTSDRSIPILNTLNDDFDLKLCVTKSDTKVGRKQEIRETQVKQWAKQNNINFLAINNVREAKQEIIDTLKQYEIEIAIVADFSFIIPLEIIETPKYKMINIHFSLLPKYRGASPVQFAILNRDEKTGVTYYVMDKGMDTGDILYQFEYKLIGNETSGEIYETLFEKASNQLVNVINEYTLGTLSPIPQKNEEATYSYSKTNPKITFILKEDALIDWKQNDEQIYAAIRAFNPWPVAWTTLTELRNKYNLVLKDNINSELKVKIYKALLSKDKNILIQELQIEGKNKTNWESFLNGYTKN